MPIDPITGLIIAGSVVGQGANIAGQSAMNKKQRQWASAEAEKAYQRNIEQWMRENAYNDPSQQMARMKAAGLNPNMIYGSGKATALSAPSPQKLAPKGQFNNPLAAVGGQQIASTAIAAQQARSIQLENMKKEYDLGLRDPKYFTETVQFLNPKTNEWEVHIVSDTKNMYYKRMKYLTESKYENLKVDKLKGALAEEGFTIQDPKLLRMINTALKEEGISMNKLTRDVIWAVLSKLGVER